MRNIVPIIFIAATLLAGCRLPATAHKTTTAGTQTVPGTSIVANTKAPASSHGVTTVKAAPTAKTVAITNTLASLKTVASNNAIASNNILVIVKTNVIDSPGDVVATPSPAGSITPAEPLSENVWLGDLGAAFIVILTILAVRRP